MKRRSFVVVSVVLLMLTASPALSRDKSTALPGKVREGTVGLSAVPQELWDQIGRRGQVVSGGLGADFELGGSNEPTVAVNPTDSSNIAYAALWEMRVSNNGGSTWQPAVSAVVDSGQVRCGDPSLAFDSQGRLFWTYLGCKRNGFSTTGIDIYIARLNPSTGAILSNYPVNVTASAGVNMPADSGHFHDKEWLAADRSSSSTYQDQLYVVWTEFTDTGTRVLTTYSTNQGQNWTAPVQLSADSGEDFVWPSHITTAPNGDVYAAYHSQNGWIGGAPSGDSGRVYVCRSTNGGSTFAQKNMAYGPGKADITFNVQHKDSGQIDRTQFWLQGSVQPWVLGDPNTAGRIYVVANDDPDDDPDSGDPANVYIVVSTNNGQTWGTPSRVDGGPDTTFQVMPTAGIDEEAGTIVVHYYDNRGADTNSAGNYLLDVYATWSSDGGATFISDFSINDSMFDPDAGARRRYNGPPPTTRIGEYNGVTAAGGYGFAVWCGNTWDAFGDPDSQQAVFDKFCIEDEPPTITCPSDTTMQANASCQVTYSGPSATAVDDCDPTPTITSSPSLPATFTGVGSYTITWIAADASGNADTCYQTITVIDVTPPEVACPPDTAMEPEDFDCEVTYSGPPATATDNCDSDPSITSEPPLPATFGSIGEHIVVFTATDFSGNASVCTMTVTVLSTSSCLKTEGIDSLGAVKPSGDEHLDKEIDKAIEHIEKSLDLDLWVDVKRLVCKHGHKVFNEEKTAVVKLVKEMNKQKFPPGLVDDFETVIGMLLDADEILGRTQLDDAIAYGGGPREIEKGESEMEKAQEKRDQGDYIHAIDHYRKGWDYACKAMSRPYAGGVQVALSRGLPSGFALSQGSPNPFSRSTVIQYQVPVSTGVVLKVYDVSGRLVRTLVDGEREAGYYAAEWDGRDGEGKKAATGIYFTRFVAGSFTSTCKMVFLR
ncbi:MAG: HYR domain-containing protein [bacterium]